MLSIEEIGPEIADSIISYFSNEESLSFINRLFGAGIAIEEMPLEKAAITEHPFSGKSFVLTGTLPTITRSEAKKMIKEKNGAVSTSVSSKIDYLILGKSPGSKLAKAKDLGVTILSEEEFLRILGEGS